MAHNRSLFQYSVTLRVNSSSSSYLSAHCPTTTTSATFSENVTFGSSCQSKLPIKWRFPLSSGLSVPFSRLVVVHRPLLERIESRGRGRGEARGRPRLHVRIAAVTVTAAAAASPTGSRREQNPQGSSSDLPPSSREEAVQQAGASLLALLDKALKDQGPATLKQRRARRQIRLRVDIPLLENSPKALSTLTFDLLQAFLGGGGRKNVGTAAVYVPESVLLDGSVSPPNLAAKFLSLGSGEGLPKDAVVALVIAPSFLQASSLSEVVKSAGVRPVVVVNAEWGEEDESDSTWGALLSSFSVAYSFVPLNVRGFFSTTEGAVLKHVKNGAPEGRPWLIFVKEGEGYRVVSSLKKRPTSADLENALYSSMALNSPVNKSIKFLRGLISK